MSKSKCFLVTKQTDTLMDGTYTEPVAIFSSHKKATACVKSMYDISDYECVSKDLYKYVFDGEMTCYYCITKYQVDKLPV